MAETAIRFGILGCAQVSCKLSKAITQAPNATLHAISSRSIDKANKFAADNGLSPFVKIYGSYEAVLDDTDVDAVYIPLPTTLHLKWAVMAAEKRKHVLLEKPVALNVSDLDRIVEACEANGVQFMDGTMWMHHPRMPKMKQLLSDTHRFGQLKSIHSCITYNAGPDFMNNSIKVKPDLDALGALGDIGWYCIRAILWAVDYELPKKVVALHGTVCNEAGVILSCGSSLHWEDGKVATFYCSFLTYITFDIKALGTKGSLSLNDFVQPFLENYGTFSEASELDYMKIEPGKWAPTPNEHVVSNEFPQEVLMVKEFADLVEKVKGKLGLKPEKAWPILSRKTQLVLDAVKESIERGYEPVEIVP
ncbi:Oxidoreductase family, NAD-binding rossmann fold protein [Quillaja saponaria]|uniref:Oxidoreductase family, NAD-binding rossmann fold protein n=1 Tax=Quillaja saponaria TaxID=32244 RepID=A0AAD7VH14_QUISA|nr:Oxidoreductase family, NAD-binding rossmann fold protein [Quillaja saponaria]